MTEDLDPRVRDAMRAALIAHVGAAARTARPWWRRWPAAAGVGALLAGGGAAVASDALRLPGADVVTARGASVEVERTGSGTVDLGPAPAGATEIEVAIECLTADRFTFEDGAAISCGPGDLERGTGSTVWAVPLEPGQTGTTITTADDARWRATVRYVERDGTDWAVNAAGQTYGVTKPDGTMPDLVAVWATNGRQGYARSADLAAASGPEPADPEEAVALSGPRPDVTIPVVDADGTTVVGEFVVQGSDQRDGVRVPSP